MPDGSYRSPRTSPHPRGSIDPYTTHRTRIPCMLQTVKYHLKSESPLLMHNGSLGDPLYFWTKKIKEITAKQKKTDADHEEIGRLEWRGGLYLDNSRPCVPDVAQKATLFNAAKTLKLGKK